MGPDSPEEPSSACILHDSCSGEVGSTSSNNTPFRRWEMAAAAGIVHQEALQEKKRCRGRLGVEVVEGGRGREGRERCAKLQRNLSESEDEGREAWRNTIWNLPLLEFFFCRFLSPLRGMEGDRPSSLQSVFFYWRCRRRRPGFTTATC